LKTRFEDLRHDVSSCVVMTVELVGREDELDEELLKTSKQDGRWGRKIQNMRRGKIRVEGEEKN
jgi:hypothetical protein